MSVLVEIRKLLSKQKDVWVTLSGHVWKVFDVSCFHVEVVSTSMRPEQFGKICYELFNTGDASYHTSEKEANAALHNMLPQNRKAKGLTFDGLRRANRDRNSLWDKKGKIGILFAAVEMFGELGELANQIKKVEREKMGLVGSPPDWDKIEKELGDAVITLDLIAMRLGVNLDTAVRKKFNADSEKHNFSIKL